MFSNMRQDDAELQAALLPARGLDIMAVFVMAVFVQHPDPIGDRRI